MRIRSIILVMLFATRLAAQVCDPSGNLFLFSNYDGGIVTINVDEDIPDLVIGISTYEPVQVTITGPFAGNVTQVLYAGMNSSQNNNNCGQGNFTTSITGVAPNLVTINPPMQPPQVGYAPAHNNGTGSWGGVVIGAAGGCDTTVNTGGVNTPDELVFHFEDQTGASLYAHQTQYACWQNDVLNLSDGGTCCIDVSPPAPVAGCDPAGNLMIYSNYDGGQLTINVDQDIPDLVIGICTYEAVAVNFVGPFVGNITAVIYAGFDGGNNNCGNNPATTVITGVPPGIVTQYSQTLGNIAIANFLGEPALPGFPPLVNCITGANGDCSTSNTGGGNSAPQIAQFFLAEFGAGTSLFGHQVQYDCFNGTFNLSDAGNCCLTETGTSPNPIYAGNATYDFIPWTDSLLCDGPITIDLSFYPVLFQPPTYPGYVWSDGTTGPVITITEPGTYSFIVGDYCHFEPGNWLTDTVVVLPCCDPGPVNTVVNAVACAGVDDGSITVAPLGPNGPFTYAWNTTPPQSTAGLMDLPPGSYSVLITDNTGCDTTLTFLLDAPPAFGVEITGDSVLCGNESTDLTALVDGGTGTVQLTWSPSGSGNPITFAPETSTTVAVTATDAAGCTVQDQLPIQVGGDVVASFTSDATAVCAGTPVQFTATAPGADSLRWSLGSAGTSNVPDPLVTFTQAGAESISLIAFAGGCASAPFTGTVVVSPAVQLQVNASASPCARTIDLSVLAVDADSCAIWLNGVPQAVACGTAQQLAVAAEGSYTVQVAASNSGGCSETSAVAVEVTEGVGLYLPNVFSPNNDGINDDFGLPYQDPPRIFELLLFNRWGQEVYRSTKPADTWKGTDVPDGVYLYTLRTEDPCEPNTVRELKGHVTVLR